MEWQKGCFSSRDLWNEMILLWFLQQVIDGFCARCMSFVTHVFSPLVLSSESPELFFLIPFHFCAWSTAQRCLLPLWYFFSASGASQALEQKQLQHGLSPAGLLSCFCPVSVHLEGTVCYSALAAAPASQKPLQFASCDTDSQEEEGLDSLSHGKCSGSSLPLAFPCLDPSSTKPLNAVCWAAVCFSLPSCQRDRKCPCGTDGSFLKKRQQYQADLVALIFSILAEC